MHQCMKSQRQFQIQLTFVNVTTETLGTNGMRPTLHASVSAPSTRLRNAGKPSCSMLKASAKPVAPPSISSNVCALLQARSASRSSCCWAACACCLNSGKSPEQNLKDKRQCGCAHPARPHAHVKVQLCCICTGTSTSVLLFGHAAGGMAQSQS